MRLNLSGTVRDISSKRGSSQAWPLSKNAGIKAGVGGEGITTEDRSCLWNIKNLVTELDKGT